MTMVTKGDPEKIITSVHAACRAAGLEVDVVRYDSSRRHRLVFGYAGDGRYIAGEVTNVDHVAWSRTIVWGFEVPGTEGERGWKMASRAQAYSEPLNLPKIVERVRQRMALVERREAAKRADAQRAMEIRNLNSALEKGSKDVRRLIAKPLVGGATAKLVVDEGRATLTITCTTDGSFESLCELARAVQKETP